jgi:hypothetical protein
MLLHISSPLIAHVLAFHKLFPELLLNVLLSYALKLSFNDFQVLHRDIIGSLILDSGAYTLNKSKWAEQPNDILQAYTHFCSLTSPYYNFLFNLDADFTLHGFDENMNNQFALEAAGLKPVPVVHNFYNGEIERLIDYGYDIIAIGQCEHGRSFSQLESAVNRIHGAERKVHLFGVTERAILQELPIWSCDSSSWAQYVIYGQVMWWNDANKNWNPYDILYFPDDQSEHDASKGKNYWDYRFRDEFDAYIGKNLNITIDNLLGSERVLYRSLVNILFYKEMEMRVTAYHRDVKGFVFKE